MQLTPLGESAPLGADIRSGDETRENGEDDSAAFAALLIAQVASMLPQRQPPTSSPSGQPSQTNGVSGVVEGQDSNRSASILQIGVPLPAQFAGTSPATSPTEPLVVAPSPPPIDTPLDVPQETAAVFEGEAVMLDTVEGEPSPVLEWNGATPDLVDGQRHAPSSLQEADQLTAESLSPSSDPESGAVPLNELFTGADVQRGPADHSDQPSGGDEARSPDQIRAGQRRDTDSTDRADGESAGAIFHLTSETRPLTPVETAKREMGMWIHQPVLNQLSQGVELAASRPGQTVHVRLHPEGLGEVNLEVSTAGSEIHLHIAVDNPGTRDLIQSNWSSLTRSLEDRGMNIAGAQVELAGGNTQGGGFQQQESARNTPRTVLPFPSEQGDEPTRRAPSNITSSTRVDYRL